MKTLCCFFGFYVPSSNTDQAYSGSVISLDLVLSGMLLTRSPSNCHWLPPADSVGFGLFLLHGLLKFMSLIWWKMRGASPFEDIISSLKVIPFFSYDL